jgi:4a-hydroxytetrahydrobiopterin dehydratase
MANAEQISRLSGEQVTEMAKSVPLWTLRDDVLSRELRFNDFAEAIAFVNRVAETADRQDHHPEIAISYNRVRLDLSTHKVGGLTSKDFALAAEINRLS